MFNSRNFSVEKIAEFNKYYFLYQIATIQSKVNSYTRYFGQFPRFQVFAIDGDKKSFEIYDLNIEQISEGPINKSMNGRLKEFYRSSSF